MESKTQEERNIYLGEKRDSKEHSSLIILPGKHKQMLSQQRPDLTSTWHLPRARTCPKDSSSQRAPSPVTSKISPFIAAMTYCMASNEEFSISNFNAIIKTSIKVFTVWLLVIRNGVMGGQRRELQSRASNSHQQLQVPSPLFSVWFLSSKQFFWFGL